MCKKKSSRKAALRAKEADIAISISRVEHMRKLREELLNYFRREEDHGLIRLLDRYLGERNDLWSEGM